jgi:TRAP-type C4-dicarboxylate transport system permease small subunit
MPKKQSGRYQIEPAEALAKWLGQRYDAEAAYQDILNRRGNQILAISERCGPRSERYVAQQNELDAAEREDERIRVVVGRPLNRWHIPFWVLVAFGLALAFFEAPVNKFLFDVALQSSNLFSWTISFGFACALLILAHIAGFSLRQIWSEHRRRIVWSSLVIFILMFFALFVLVSILTIARAWFSAEAGTIRDLVSDVTSTVQAVGIWTTLRNAFADISALVLVTVNIGGILMTMMLSFFTHDPDKDLDAASRAVERHRARLAKIAKEFVSSKEKIVRDFAPQLAGHGANYKTANKNVIELKKRLGQPLDEQDNRVIDERDRLAEDSEHWLDISSPGPQIEIVSDRTKAPGATQQASPGPGRRDPTFTDGRRQAG